MVSVRIRESSGIPGTEFVIDGLNCSTVGRFLACPESSRNGHTKMTRRITPIADRSQSRFPDWLEWP